MRGFTLIELTVVIALIAAMIGVFFLVGNPAGQLAGSRNTERSLQLQAIMQAIRQNIADQSNEKFSCASGPLPTSSKKMASTGANTYNIGPCLVTTYLYSLPFDPSASSSHYNSVTDYDTGYTIAINSSGTITLSAPNSELGKIQSVSR